MRVRTAKLADGQVVKSHHLFGNCQHHRGYCGCFSLLQRRFDKHISKLIRQSKYEEADRKRRKFNTLVAHEYAFVGA